MKRFVGLLFAPLLSLPLLGGQQDLSSLRNFLWVEAEFCTGGQPSLEHLSQLASQGVRGVLNLREPHEHNWADEQAKTQALGLKYFSIPVAPRNPKDVQVDQFLRLTDNTDLRPLFIHCTAAVRVGAFWMIRRVLKEGWSIEKAEEEAARIGLRLGSDLHKFSLNYIKTNKGSH